MFYKRNACACTWSTVCNKSKSVGKNNLIKFSESRAARANWCTVVVILNPIIMSHVCFLNKVSSQLQLATVEWLSPNGTFV